MVVCGALGGRVAVVGVGVVDADVVGAGVRELGVSGGVVIVHSSLSALGRVEGGADAVVRGLLKAAGTVVVPAFTPQVADPFPDYVGAGDASAAAGVCGGARVSVRVAVSGGGADRAARGRA
ncbi:AAC(3) family N-acetyltransferase [Amycolatopsis sp. VS8301801F10]|uniref:AAC(3) family N-acetyltransferase n=1 Tax=Amycolatopsis sp. VS8301801F10 TaxID=2652442 RepID=UPI0038FC4565